MSLWWLHLLLWSFHLNELWSNFKRKNNYYFFYLLKFWKTKTVDCFLRVSWNLIRNIGSSRPKMSELLDMRVIKENGLTQLWYEMIFFFVYLRRWNVMLLMCWCALGKVTANYCQFVSVVGLWQLVIRVSFFFALSKSNIQFILVTCHFYKRYTSSIVISNKFADSAPKKKTHAKKRKANSQRD